MALTMTYRRLSHFTPSQAERISPLRATSLPCLHVTEADFLLLFINWPMGLLLPGDCEPLEGRIWISHTWQKPRPTGASKVTTDWACVVTWFYHSVLPASHEGAVLFLTGEALTAQRSYFWSPSHTSRKWWNLQWSLALSKVWLNMLCGLSVEVWWIWICQSQGIISKCCKPGQHVLTLSVLLGSKEDSRNRRKSLEMSKWRYSHHLGHIGDRINLGHRKQPQILCLLEREGAGRV